MSNLATSSTARAGRIYLIKDMLENDKPASEKVVTHIDRCLTCLSCMTTCPSGRQLHASRRPGPGAHREDLPSGAVCRPPACATSCAPMVLPYPGAVPRLPLPVRVLRKTDSAFVFGISGGPMKRVGAMLALAPGKFKRTVAGRPRYQPSAPDGASAAAASRS